MSQFEELLAQLKAAEEEQALMAKALPAEDGEDDETIQAAAAEDAEADDEDKNPEDADDDDDAGKMPMAKSVMATIDGVPVEALDATDMLKSLLSRVDTQETTLAKALQMTLGTIKSQGDMIKSLQAQVVKLSSQGGGRKTVLTVMDKPAAGGDPQTLAKSQQDGLTPQEFMAKATAAFSAGKLSGQELTTADVAIRSGVPIPAGIIAKALS